MTLRQVSGPKGVQHGVAVLEQPELVGDGALAFAQQPGGLLLAHAPLPDQPGNALGLLDIVQILPLQIFHQGCHPGLLVVHAHDDTGNIRHPRQFRCPQPPLSGDQLIAGAAPADGQGL